MKILYVVIVGLLLNVALWAKVENFVDVSTCDRVIDKQLYEICYSDKFKGALSGWVRLDGSLVNNSNIKKRTRFYSETSIPDRFRSNYQDYTGHGKKYNRGHFIVADADFDYSDSSLELAYTMANIIPQSALVNQKTWTKVERYGRKLATKFGYINSISIAEYKNPKHKIKNNVVIPSGYYRIYYNDDESFEQCFYYGNEVEVDYKSDKLKDHKIDCGSIKIK